MRTFMKRIVAAFTVRVAALKKLRQAEQQIYLKALQKQQAKRETKIMHDQQEPALSEEEQLYHTAG